MLQEQDYLERLNSRTKPTGALGQLETLALQICRLQGTSTPAFKAPAIFVFAADHGLAAAGVSAYPQAVTAQMVQNFLNGGAAINVFTRLHGLALQIVDAGVATELPPHPDKLERRIAAGTRNLREAPAMTAEQYALCERHGRALISDWHARTGGNVVGFGEMGIGNTSSAALIMHTLTGLPLVQCVGRGTGLDDAGLARKREILSAVLSLHRWEATPESVLTTFGGFEIAMMAAAMREAARLGILILIDGFIASSAYLAAVTADPALRAAAVFCHCSGELGHRALLDYLQAKPLLDLGLRLGEGTGCALAWPLVRSAAAFMTEMAGFSEAGVSERDA
jgi:nicotinate-nucleotide--dimethylbenzimidazole phosphoribosyltransferase